MLRPCGFTVLGLFEGKCVWGGRDPGDQRGEPVGQSARAGAHWRGVADLAGPRGRI